MSDIKNIHDVSAFYFFLIAFIYIFSAFALRNGVMLDITPLIIRVMDIPFALVGLLYGGSTIYLQMNSKNDQTVSPWIMVIFTIGLIIFALVVFINFAFPSQI